MIDFLPFTIGQVSSKAQYGEDKYLGARDEILYAFRRDASSVEKLSLGISWRSVTLNAFQNLQDQ